MNGKKFKQICTVCIIGDASKRDEKNPGSHHNHTLNDNFQGETECKHYNNFLILIFYDESN